MSFITDYSDLFNVQNTSSSTGGWFVWSDVKHIFTWKVLIGFLFAIIVALSFMYYKDIVKYCETIMENVFGIHTNVVKTEMNTNNNTNSTTTTTTTITTTTPPPTHETNDTTNRTFQGKDAIDRSHQNILNKEVPLEDIKYVSFLISKRSGMTTKKIGSLLFEIFTTQLPRTSHNFLAISKANYYNDVPFHRVIKDFMIQGGDIINGNGTGSYNIYHSEHPFEDEGFLYNHTHAGLLSMANSGKDTNGCQFFITLAPCPHLDNKHVVFGRLVDEESYQVLNEIGNAETDKNDCPLDQYVIENTELHDKDFLVNQINEKTLNIANKINKLNEVSQTFSVPSTSSLSMPNSRNAVEENDENVLDNIDEDNDFTETIADLN